MLQDAFVADVATDGFQWKIDEMVERVNTLKQNDLYYYHEAISELDGAWVVANGKRKLMFATYSYLGLLQHPDIIKAAREALERYGTGTHGVRLLGGTLDIHVELEETIARFHGRDAALPSPAAMSRTLRPSRPWLAKVTG